MGEDSPQKRKRPTDDFSERDQKKVHLEDRRLGIENLHLDVGEKYLLCRTRKAPFTCTEQKHLVGAATPSLAPAHPLLVVSCLSRSRGVRPLAETC